MQPIRAQARFLIQLLLERPIELMIESTSVAPLMSEFDVVDGCAGRSAKGRRWKSVTVKE